jgi:FkbM family methyltransferase
MDYWPNLLPVSQLPFSYRAWAWWLRNGPKRGEGTLGGSRVFAVLRWLRRARAGTPYVTLSAIDHPRLTIDLTDFESFHHALAVWYRGDAEMEVLRRLTAGDGTFIDAGANFGVYSLAVARSSPVPVLAIEPQTHLAEAIRRSANANGFENLRVVQTALGDETGSTTLHLPPGGSGAASIVRHEGVRMAAHIAVGIITLDQLCHDFGVMRVQCLKMDVEGAEIAVIRGARSVLQRDQPFILFEASDDESEQSPVFCLLREFGYSSFHDAPSAIGQADGPARKDGRVRNIIAVPAGKQELYAALFSRS